MKHSSRTLLGAASLVLTLFSKAGATSIPAMSFEELTDHSELVVSGRIDRAWADWDADRRYIWTHYELEVTGALKGAPGSLVTLSEPGGVAGLQGMSIAGSVVYQPGETVLVFLRRMPNGYLRTTGWSQGKYRVDKAQRLHAAALPHDIEEVSKAEGRTPATALRSLDGMRVTDLRGLIALRIQTLRAQARNGVK